MKDFDTEIIAATLEMAELRGMTSEEAAGNVDRMSGLMAVGATFVGDLATADRSAVDLLALAWAMGYEIGKKVAEGSSAFMAMRAEYENDTGKKFSETKESVEEFMMWMVVRRMKSMFAETDEDSA